MYKEIFYSSLNVYKYGLCETIYAMFIIMFKIFFVTIVIDEDHHEAALTRIQICVPPREVWRDRRKCWFLHLIWPTCVKHLGIRSKNIHC